MSQQFWERNKGKEFPQNEGEIFSLKVRNYVKTNRKVGER